jgi:hypothetical protein
MDAPDITRPCSYPVVLLVAADDDLRRRTRSFAGASGLLVIEAADLDGARRAAKARPPRFVFVPRSVLASAPGLFRNLAREHGAALVPVHDEADFAATMAISVPPVDCR